MKSEKQVRDGIEVLERLLHAEEEDSGTYEEIEFQIKTLKWVLDEEQFENIL